ncbi:MULTISPECIES: GUN4 domain-containing protein [unclassified Nodularia (in: cyanobacteria)]|uniref:GUN4 domain-containing protein n=1 Tax=unclassified Nodularia (in: cyanobacteria) TaxID=2656917 RepID=UPI001882427B|nr:MULTISPECIES: GUN4 domain-containing protein [unclassified Nodularia (in: cyanobacteria)]MBE9199115.1 GUN4 domain-containing protein [Nodularia sp. LEGE 06071]MCC2694673.1 GUN4 domain-containing protein [Nodularia sp. LEGE 04288]
MRQCLNPECLHPNPDNFQFCQKCGSKLLLRERYAPQSILGQGGFGRTFLAIDEDKPSKPFCVIKQFLPQAQGTDSIEKASQLFSQEAERLEELGKHPQIPELMAYFTADNRQYLVQEFVKGETLQAELEQNGVFSEQQIRELLIELLDILQFVHSQQVIHRDIKPENIIRRSADNKLFLVDFGAAKVVEQKQRTATGTMIGSAEYCAPEQLHGKPKFISDLYSLGVTCLHLLTQISPFDLYDVMEGEWVWRDYLTGNVVSDELGKILEKLANPIPKQRYQSVEEVIHALNPVRQSVTPSSASQVSSQPSFQRFQERGTTRSITPQQVELKSAVGMDYSHLRYLLAAGKWKEADEETKRVMLAVAKREKEGWLNEESIDNFPCDDLGTIDQLWLKYSNGRFGFSVQKRIYQSLGGTRNYDPKIWEAFGDKVGWRKGRIWLDYSNITFDIAAPEAHLPSPRGVDWGGLVLGWFCVLFSRVETCEL